MNSGTLRPCEVVLRRSALRIGAVYGGGTVRVLVTNDDGVGAPGLHHLALALAERGHDVLVVAPLEDRSGSGAGIGPVHLGAGVAVEPVKVDDLRGLTVLGVDGPPALAVMTANLGAFGEPPQLVASGINPGPNTGRSVLHSGTVGAALTAANLGVSGLAVSIGVGDTHHWATAAALAAAAAHWLTGAPAGTVLNLNVPNRALGDLAGVRSARLAPFGTVRAAIAESGEGRLQVELRDTEAELDPDTDTALVEAGFAAVTSLVGVTATGEADAPAFLERQLELSGQSAPR